MTDAPDQFQKVQPLAIDPQSHLDALAKPQASLGRLEALAVRLAMVQQRLDPVMKPRRLVLFAGDHGVVAQGVSAWPSAVTGMMIATIAVGWATSSALAAAHDCGLRLVDVGSIGPALADPPAFYSRAHRQACRCAGQCLSSAMADRLRRCAGMPQGCRSCACPNSFRRWGRSSMMLFGDSVAVAETLGVESLAGPKDMPEALAALHSSALPMGRDWL
jgi:hypothetical protein